MAQASKTKKPSGKFGTQLRSKNLTGRNKIIGLTVLAFAVVGAILLIRSYAATTVFTLNPGDALTTTAGLTTQNGTVVTESVTANKKVTNMNLVELSSGAGKVPSTLVYTFKLNAGDYQGCFTAKPTTAMANGHVEVHDTTQSYSRELWYVKESTSTNYPNYGKSFALNTPKEICTNFTVAPADVTKNFQLSFAADPGSPTAQPVSTWRVSNITIRLGAGNYASLL